MVLQALVRFTELKDCVVFTSRTNLNKRIDDSRLITKESLEYYQRRIDTSRIGDIENFIVSSILDEREGIILATLFPSSMILAVEEEDGITQDEDGICNIRLKNNVFIVDGQHRMLAMMRVYDKLQKNAALTESEKDYIAQYLESYKFNCTILVNYDLWEQGQVFINVNFKQKPVNKSLYYEIFGSEYREKKADWRRNKIYLAHCLAKVLNDHPSSPFLNQIKMLGTGAGYVSQAFVVEALLPLFNNGGIWAIDTDSDKLSSTDYAYFSTELVSFFYTIHKMFTRYWPTEGATKGTLICKTTGFGAFCRLMATIREADDMELVNALKRSTEQNMLCEPYIQFVENKLEPLQKTAERLFGKDSDFANNTGKAAEKKLYKQMLANIQKANNSIDEDITGLDENDTDKIYEQIQEYLWGHVISELDELAYQYEVEDISDFKITSYQPNAKGFSVECSFEINTTLYLDNEDDRGFMMSFPTKMQADFNSDKEIEEDSITFSIDTSKYNK